MLPNLFKLFLSPSIIMMALWKSTTCRVLIHKPQTHSRMPKKDNKASESGYGAAPPNSVGCSLVIPLWLNCMNLVMTSNQVYGSPQKCFWESCEIWLTAREISINHSKVVVSTSRSLSPPTAQICSYVYANNIWTIWLETKFFFFKFTFPSFSSNQDDSIECQWCSDHVQITLTQRFSIFQTILVVHEQIWWRAHRNGHECVMKTMNWVHEQFWQSASYWSKDMKKNDIFVYNFWKNWPKSQD